METDFCNRLIYGMGKGEMMDIIKNYNEDQFQNNLNCISSDSGNDSDFIYLKHGTNANNLKSILKTGLTGRKFNLRNNFEHAESSENLIYLTNKWHYMYSFIAVKVAYDKYLLNKGLDPSELELTDDYSNFLLDYWEETGNVPVVLTVKVKKEDLMIDEDIVFNSQFLKRLKEEKSIHLKDISYEYSLLQYTVSCKKNIKVSDILKIDIIAYDDIFEIMGNSEYGKSFSTWCNGFLTEYDSEDIYDLMIDNNLGGIDELFIENDLNNYQITYDKDASCVLISYN